jgi:hypothetical protein
MASVFSYYAASFHSPHYIPDSSLTVELIRLLIATIANPLIRNAPHPFMEPRRMSPTGPRGNQGGLYDILRQVAIESSRSGVLVGRHRLSVAE